MENNIQNICSRYFYTLPVPQSFGGWFKLSFFDWIRLIPPTAIFAGFCHMLYRAYWPGARKCKLSDTAMINPKIRKYQNKVVDAIDTHNIYDQATFCRCWRTKNWPYCDGSHAAYNLENADNVGPLIAKRHISPPLEERNSTVVSDVTERTL